MGEVIVITSGKGGVGKTTTTANVGTGLAMLGKKVVLIDTDIGLRNLDVVMGLENRIVYNLVDVVENNCRIKQALIKDKRYPNLYLLPSAQTKDKTAVTPEQMKKLADDLKEEANNMMVQLNRAKQRGDVKAIRSLVARLQQGFEPLMASDRLNDLERIRKKMAQVREQIDILVNELAELEKEESWLLVSSLSNMEAYFAQQEKALHEVRASLEHQVSEAQLDSAA